MFVGPKVLKGGNEHDLGDTRRDDEGELMFTEEFADILIVVVLLIHELIEFAEDFAGLFHLLEAVLGVEFCADDEFRVLGHLSETLSHIIRMLLVVEVEETLEFFRVEVEFLSFGFEGVSHVASDMIGFALFGFCL